MRTLWRFIAGFFKWTWRLLNFVREMVLNPDESPNDFYQNH